MSRAWSSVPNWSPVTAELNTGAFYRAEFLGLIQTTSEKIDVHLSVLLFLTDGPAEGLFDGQVKPVANPK